MITRASILAMAEFTVGRPTPPCPASIATRLALTMGLWRERARMRRELRLLDERLIADAGLTVGEADRESAKPFWAD